jgi:chaperone modulatory protein CbpM
MFPDLREAELIAWVERGWVKPEGASGAWEFAEIDIARIRLIRDFRHAMAVPDETMPLVLSLLDQVYMLRGQMRAIARALEQQPDAVRQAVLIALRERDTALSDGKPGAA